MSAAQVQAQFAAPVVNNSPKKSKPRQTAKFPGERQFHSCFFALVKTLIRNQIHPLPA
jgi:hypothetical protein